MRKLHSLTGAVLLIGLSRQGAVAQLIGNIQVNEGVHADNDFPPVGTSTQNSTTDSVVPFQRTISANDGTGSSVTGTFGLTGNGQTLSFTVSASGALTANGNDFGSGSLPASTDFQLLQPASYTAEMTCTGSAGVGNDIIASLDIFNGNESVGSLGASGAFPTNSTSGTLDPGTITILDSWGIGYNDAPHKPTSESGSYTLTLTVAAIPEPASEALLAIPTVYLLARRRKSTGGRF